MNTNEFNALIAGLREAAAKAKQIELGTVIGYLLVSEEN